MALGDRGYGETKHERWEAQNDDLPDGDHVGRLFEFRCWEAKSGLDYASFGFEVDCDGSSFKVQRFYGLVTKSGANRGWVLERDLRMILGRSPDVEEIQSNGHTGPIASALVGARVRLYKGERSGYHDLYIDGLADAASPVSVSDFD